METPTWGRCGDLWAIQLFGNIFFQHGGMNNNCPFYQPSDFWVRDFSSTKYWHCTMVEQMGKSHSLTLKSWGVGRRGCSHVTDEIGMVN